MGEERNLGHGRALSVWPYSVRKKRFTAETPGFPREFVITAERALMAAILVVEDDVFIREYAEAMIHDWGHEILSACDVPEALVHLRSEAHIDAMFTDIYLKDEVHGGCDLARQAILLRPELRILYTTGNRVTDSLRALFATGTHFLSKPYTEDQLGLSVHNMLAA
jgi:CheY-like chemotaxis protein